jgi:prevent-host-death family protein
MLSTNQKGAIAETRIVAAAVELGIEVYRPVAEGGRFDMIFAFADASLARVQCKWAPLQDGVVTVRPYSCRRSANGFVYRRYTVHEIDALAAYCPELGRCYYLEAPLVANRRGLSLRVAPTGNNQASGVNWAADYELGAIAQLGERWRGTPEAAGSSPASSTPSQTEVGCHEFRNHFGFYLERAAAGDEILVRRRGRAFARLVPA